MVIDSSIMKRILIALVAAVCSLTAVMGQESEKTVIWGVRAGIDVNIPGKWHGNGASVDMFKNGCGFTAGAVCNVWLGRAFYLEPGLSLFYDTYSFDDLILADNAGEPAQSDPSLYKVGLRLPVMVGYSFNIAQRLLMSVYTGPELSYAFGGKVRLDENVDTNDIDTAFDLFGPGGQRRLDCAWKIGVAAPIGPISMSLDCALGLTNLNRSEMSFREYRVTVGATYYF